MSRDVTMVWVRLMVPMAGPNGAANCGTKIEVTEDYARQLVAARAAEYVQPVDDPANKPAPAGGKPKKPGKGKSQRNDPPEVETRSDVSGESDETDDAKPDPPAE